MGTLAVVPASSAALWLKFMVGRINRDEYYAAHVFGLYVAGDDIKAARFIQERTGAADTVVVWGNNALVNFLSGRANCTRFVFAMPLTAGGPGSPRAAYRREYIREVQKSLPAYIVVGLPHGSGDKELVLKEFPEFEALLHERYYLETRIGFLDLYRRNQKERGNVVPSPPNSLRAIGVRRSYAKGTAAN